MRQIQLCVHMQWGVQWGCRLCGDGCVWHMGGWQ